MSETTMYRTFQERYGRDYWAVYDGERATALEATTTGRIITGVYECGVEAVPEGGVHPLGDVQECPWLGHCTSNAYGRRITDEVRQAVLAADFDADAIYALLTDLHNSVGA